MLCNVKKHNSVYSDGTWMSCRNLLKKMFFNVNVPLIDTSCLSRKFSTSTNFMLGDQKPPVLTHVDESGNIRMVDVSKKSPSVRIASAEARVHLGPVAFLLVEKNKIAKGDVITVAHLAGIAAAKKTSELIPLCHNIVIDHVKIDITLKHSSQELVLQSSVKTTSKTGADVEAMAAVCVAALTVYDMCKSVSRDVSILEVRLLSKTGGKEDFIRT